VPPSVGRARDSEFLSIRWTQCSPLCIIGCYRVGSIAFGGYQALATYTSGFGAIALALGFYGILQRWGIEEPNSGEPPDAYVWAALCGFVALGSFAAWWWFLGPPALQAWSTHV
jgi:hypothetical protein